LGNRQAFGRRLGVSLGLPVLRASHVDQDLNVTFDAVERLIVFVSPFQCSTEALRSGAEGLAKTAVLAKSGNLLRVEIRPHLSRS
jgi:hypothetical protein